MVKVVGRKVMWNSVLWIVILALLLDVQGSSDYFISHPDHRVASGKPVFIFHFLSFVELYLFVVICVLHRKNFNICEM